MQDEVIIKPGGGWALPRWKTITQNFDLLFVLVRREFLSKYRQTILGPAWYIAQPLFTGLIFTALFSSAAKMSTDGIPPLLFYFCGLLSWGYFVGCLEATAGSLVNNSALFQKVYFPRILVPLSLVIAKMYSYFVQLAVFLLFVAFYHLKSGTFSFHPNWTLAFYPLILVQTAALALGVGLWVAALSTQYRDFHHLLGFAIQLWMYATPIIYPLSLIQEKWRGWVLLNPMCAVTEAYRRMFFGVGGVSFAAHAWSAALTFFIIVTGLLMFQRVERRFVDTL
ncbi:MAG: ABC transporter permease [Deltaproteobacteria bacterium]|nr:ABC transporter permease [Deltaproteobacteria bacterium]MBI3293870.1 ABC transporter permease [Deltaproteobacteria bacterium]